MTPDITSTSSNIIPGTASCILVPNYNHGRGFPQLINRLLEYDLPIIVINDGSDRETKEILDSIPQKFPSVRVLHLLENRGKGAAVMAGFREAWKAGYTHALQVDADGQHDLDDIHTFLELGAAYPAAVINGCPVYDETVPAARKYARYITHFWVWVETLSFSIKDSMCGFRLYPLAPVIQLIDRTSLGKRMDFDTEILVRLYWQGLEILSVSTRVIYPEDGLSNFRLWHDNWLITRMHTRLFLGMLIRIPSLFMRKNSRQQSNHWAAFREKGSVTGMSILLWIYRHLGRLPFLIVLHPVILYFSLSSGSARKASRQFVERIRSSAETGEERDAQPVAGWKTAYRHFYNFGVSALDKIACWSGEIKRSDVNIHGAEHFEKLLASGNGAVFLGSHLGNLEISRALGEKGGRFRINAMVFNKHALKFQRVLVNCNPQAEVNLIHVENLGIDTVILLKQKIDDGEIVIIVGDRTPVKSIGRVQYVEFLGQPAPFSEGPFMLASVLECPVYLLFCLKEKRKYNVYLEPFAQSMKFSRSQRAELLTASIQKYADRLAWFCKKEPLQWFNFYDFWHHDNSRGAGESNSQLNAEQKP